MEEFIENNNTENYDVLPLTKLVEIFENNKFNEAFKVAFYKYHEISEERYMTLTQSFWGKTSEMDYTILTKDNVREICTLNDGMDTTHNYKFIKFDPTDLARADDITYTPIHEDDWSKTSSCYLINLFDLLYITMDNDDFILLTKGFEYIQVDNPTPTSSKPFILKGCTIVPFKILNSNGETKGCYDISTDPGLIN